MKYKRSFLMIIVIFLYTILLISLPSLNIKAVNKNIFTNENTVSSDNLVNEYITIKGNLRKVKEHSIVLINTKYVHKENELINIKNKMAEININKDEHWMYNSYERDREITMKAKFTKRGILIIFFDEGKIQ